MLPLGGTHAGMTVSDDIREAVEGGARAVKVDVDQKGEKLVCGGCVPAETPLTAAFEAVRDMLEDAVPCLVLIRLQDSDGSIDGAGPNDFAMLGWTPSGSPPKLRMLCASSRKTIRDVLPALSFKDYNTSEKEEITFEGYREATRAMTDQERRDAMTREEQDLEDVKKQIDIEKSVAPKMMAGMAALQIEADSSFREVLAGVAEGGKGCIGRISDGKTNEILGSVLDGVSTPSDLKGKLPADEPCYVIMKSPDVGPILISWLPDGVKAKDRMKFSSFKASVVQVSKSLMEIDKLPTCEITDEADLTDDLCKHTSQEESSNAVPVAGGFKPPVGGFALPGMGK